MAYAPSRILRAQRRDQIQRTAKGWDRIWGWITGMTLGYGYQPWRALLFLLTVLFTSVVLATTVGAHGGLTMAGHATTAYHSCGLTDQLGAGLDLGQALTVIDWLLQVLAWAFAALFIAGFTGAVRKT